MPDPYDDTVESEPADWTTPRRKGSNVRSGTAYRQLQAQFREHCRLHRNPDGTYGLGCWQCPRPMDYRLQYPHPYSFSLDHDLSIRSHPELAAELGQLQARPLAVQPAAGWPARQRC
jgi:hypothetical protein